MDVSSSSSTTPILISISISALKTPRRFILNHPPAFTCNLYPSAAYKPPIPIPIPVLLHTRRNIILSPPIPVVNHEISAITSSSHPHITWQILIGALAGVIPFVVAGIEFSKRIVEQRNCKVCKGSGLVLRDAKYYFRCPRCGGFLPWQSWRRFFTG